MKDTASTSQRKGGKDARSLSAAYRRTENHATCRIGDQRLCIRTANFRMRRENRFQIGDRTKGLPIVRKKYRAKAMRGGEREFYFGKDGSETKNSACSISRSGKKKRIRTSLGKKKEKHRMEANARKKRRRLLRKNFVCHLQYPRRGKGKREARIYSHFSGERRGKGPDRVAEGGKSRTSPCNESANQSCLPKQKRTPPRLARKREKKRPSWKKALEKRLAPKEVATLLCP